MASSHFGGLPGSDPSSADATGAAGLDLNVLKSLSDRRATRTDGAPPKRRGPKPDSKPALTRRQELNRQAQRTHRERKENYVKALEEEVLRLKEVYSAASQDKNRLAEENRQLKEVLVHHGIPLPETFRHPSEAMGSPHDNSYASTTSTSGQSHATGSQSSFSPPSTTQSIAPSAASSVPPLNPPTLGGQHLRDLTSQASTSKGYDYEQAGIDFVLTLERPCMDHLPFLLERASKPDSGPCGHALMASCPLHPVTGLAPHDTFGRTHVQDDTNSGQQTWDISKGDLSTLLDLSMKLDLEGEITPVRAWGMILGHPKFLQLGAPEIKMMAEELGRKVRCYGFGAVTEEFEVRDAIEGALTNVC